MDFYRVLDADGRKLFSVYLVHSLPLRMSAVQLFVGDRMAAVAHLVDSNTLGNVTKELGLQDDVRNFNRSTLHAKNAS